MNLYREHSKDLWDYLDDIPYMPSRADRDKLLASNDPARVQIWDYFFRIKPEDVGKPQKEEIKTIDDNIHEEISRYTQKQKDIDDFIKQYKKILLWKRLKNFLYGGICLILAVVVYKYILDKGMNIDWLSFCTLPFLVCGLILWLAISIVGWDEKREIET